MQNNMKKILIDAARQAGGFLLKNFRNSEFSQIAVNKGRFDYSIKMDKMTEDLILKILRENGIKGKVVAEETGEISLGTSDYTLYIDPLDGTFNYAHGIPHYGTSIGVEKDGEFVIGVIYDPNVDELFYAEKGHGAFLNKKRLQVSKTEGFEHAMINLLSGYIKTHPELVEFYTNLVLQSHVRMPMSAVLALAYTACGRTDATIGFGENVWDVAAGIVLVEEAGGKVTDSKGENYKTNAKGMVASNGKMHKKLLDILAIK